MYAYMLQNQEFLWKSVLGKMYFRSKNWKILGVQAEQSTDTMLWKSIWDLILLDFSLCIGNAAAICFLFKQLCESCQMKINVKNFSAAGQRQSLQIFCKIGVLKTFAKINRKASALKSPFNKVKASNYIEKTLQHICFPIDFAKYGTYF